MPLATLLYTVGGMPWLIWGFFVRTVLLLHSTWLVNAATHTWGSRPFATRDTSTNLRWVALVAYGEGWHNHHHAYPTSARHGPRWWQVDTTDWAIRLLALARLARGETRKAAGEHLAAGPSSVGRVELAGMAR